MHTARPSAFSRAAALRTLGFPTVALAGFAALLSAGLTGCKSDAPAPIITNNSVAADPGGADPAAANMAGSSAGQPTQVMGQSQSYTPQQQGESYYSGQQAPAPIEQGYSNAQSYNNGAVAYDQGYAAGEEAEAATAPPPLPEYDQPPAPDPNDIWTPGYWNYASTGYYWVPGTWVAAPYYGALWTPPYWGYSGNRYRFHHGYWGPHIGYYGGINYGFGYIGVGYYGGYWRGHDFFYNRAVNHVGGGFGNVYDRPVIVNNIRYNREPTVRVSFNGGPGGINAQPRPFEVAAERERHLGPVPAQVALREQASTNRGNFYAANQGRPAQVAFAHPPVAAAGFNGGNRPGTPEGNTGFNRPGGPAAQPFNRPGEVANRPGVPTNQPFNRPGAPVANPGFNRPNEPGNRPGAPMNHPFNRPGAPVANPGFNRPNEPGNRPGAPANQPFNRPGAPVANPGFNRPNETGNRPGAPANQPFNRPGAEPGNRPGGFNNPAVTRPVNPAPAQPHVNQPVGNPGFSRPVPENRPVGNAGFNRPGPAPHVDAPRPAPAPHIEPARPAPAPTPHVEAPHGPPAGGGRPGPAPGGPHEGGGHPR